jgi:hypothetical protein
MSVAELVPVVQALPRPDKYRLLQLIIEQLAEEETTPFFREGHVYPVYTPAFAPDAATQLAQALDLARKAP